MKFIQLAKLVTDTLKYVCTSYKYSTKYWMSDMYHLGIIGVHVYVCIYHNDFKSTYVKQNVRYCLAH